MARTPSMPAGFAEYVKTGSRISQKTEEKPKTKVTTSVDGEDRKRVARAVNFLLKEMHITRVSLANCSRVSESVIGRVRNIEKKVSPEVVNSLATGVNLEVDEFLSLGDLDPEESVTLALKTKILEKAGKFGLRFRAKRPFHRP